MKQALTTIYYAALVVCACTVVILATSSFELPFGVRTANVSGASSAAVVGDGVIALRHRGDSLYTQGSHIMVLEKSGHGSVHTVQGMINEAGISSVQLKGDGGQTSSSVRARDVYGVVVATVPYLGVFISFANTLFGIVLLVGIPLFMLALDLIQTVARTTRSGTREIPGIPQQRAYLSAPNHVDQTSATFHEERETTYRPALVHRAHHGYERVRRHSTGVYGYQVVLHA